MHYSSVLINKERQQTKSPPYTANTLNMACCPSFWASWSGVSPSWLGKVSALWPLGWWIKKRERWTKPKRTARWRRVSLGWSSAAGGRRRMRREWKTVCAAALPEINRGIILNYYFQELCKTFAHLKLNEHTGVQYLNHAYFKWTKILDHLNIYTRSSKLYFRARSIN